MASDRACSSKQLSLFDESILDSLSGKTYPARSVQTADLILKPCSKKSCKSPFLYLNTAGATPAWLTVETVSFVGGLSTANFGAFPNVVKESFLSQILQDDVPPKYFLSPRACTGILRRLRNQNVTPPPELLSALTEQLSIKASTRSSNPLSNANCNQL